MPSYSDSTVVCAIEDCRLYSREVILGYCSLYAGYTVFKGWYSFQSNKVILIIAYLLQPANAVSLMEEFA